MNEQERRKPTSARLDQGPRDHRGAAGGVLRVEPVDALPWDAEAEIALLGSILLKPKVLDDVRLAVDAGDFFEDGNALLFSNLSAMYDEGLPADDVVLVAHRLKSAGDLERVGGCHRLAELGSAVPYAANAVYYAQVIRRLAVQRRLVVFAQTLAGQAANLEDPRELIAEASRTLDGLAEPACLRRFGVITSAELATGAYQTAYWIDGILAKGQDTILAGIYKSLKTSIAIDLAIALATGGMFLGRFPVLEPARVLFMSAESGFATIQETAKRICRAAGVELDEIKGLLWSTELPRPDRPDEMTNLRILLRHERIDVLILDPAYLMMPGDGAWNLLKQGEVLSVLSGLCRSLGVTLVLIHHAKKSSAGQFQPMELGDLTMAGFAEFARQWILLSRRERYVPGSGIHRLSLSVGGSAGHSGRWGLDVDEGVGHGKRHWQVAILDPADTGPAAAARKQDAKAEKAAAVSERVLRLIVDELARRPQGETKRALRELFDGVGPKGIDLGIDLGLERGLVVPCEFKKPPKMELVQGYKLAEPCLLS